MTTSGKLRAGVIGVGHLGRHHARIYSEIPDVELVGVSDVNADSLNSITSKFNCKGYADYRDMIEQVDLVSVAVPTTEHFAVAGPFLAAGKHVLVEKPITATVDEGNRLVRQAQENDRVLMVGQSERFNPAIASASEFVKAARFIEVHRLGPFTSRATDVDVVLDLMIHDIDLILSWVSSDVVDVRASGVPVLTQKIDIANARIEFADGCNANITASRISLQATRKVRVFQADSYISIDCMNQSISCFRRKAGDVPPDNPMAAIEPVPFTIDKVEPLYSELSAFVQAVQGKIPAPVPGTAGLKALEMCTLISDLIRKNMKS